MEDLLKALNILLAYREKYPDAYYAISASHDELFLGGPGKGAVTEEDEELLNELSVYWDEEVDSWRMFT